MFSLQNRGKVSPSSRVHCSARLGIIVAIYYGEEKSAGCVASGMTMESHKTRWRCGRRRRRSLLGHCEATPERLLAGKESHGDMASHGAEGTATYQDRGLGVRTQHPQSLLLLLSLLKLFRQQVPCQGMAMYYPRARYYSETGHCPAAGQLCRSRDQPSPHAVEASGTSPAPVPAPAMPHGHSCKS